MSGAEAKVLRDQQDQQDRERAKATIKSVLVRLVAECEHLDQRLEKLELQAAEDEGPAATNDPPPLADPTEKYKPFSAADWEAEKAAKLAKWMKDHPGEAAPIDPKPSPAQPELKPCGSTAIWDVLVEGRKKAEAARKPAPWDTPPKINVPSLREICRRVRAMQAAHIRQQSEQSEAAIAARAAAQLTELLTAVIGRLVPGAAKEAPAPSPKTWSRPEMKMQPDGRF